jgi:hypothetical protein
MSQLDTMTRDDFNRRRRCDSACPVDRSVSSPTTAPESPGESHRLAKTDDQSRQGQHDPLPEDRRSTHVDSAAPAECRTRARCSVAWLTIP